MDMSVDTGITITERGRNRERLNLERNVCAYSYGSFSVPPQNQEISV
jgi:hypothetical protein